MSTTSCTSSTTFSPSADVHYTAAHCYDPARATFTDFDAFWKFVCGPRNVGTFGPNALDATFGPEVRFQRAADRPKPARSSDGGTGAG
jgi:alkaline phosphatase D